MPLHEPSGVLWEKLISQIRHPAGIDAVIWNRTPAHSLLIGHELQREMLRSALERGIPTIAFHLDRWWGLQREHELLDEPYFACEYVFTADGHDPERWRRAGINHHWSPPAISARNVARGVSKPSLAVEAVFIGSTRDYHSEWTHRGELIRWMKRFYGKQFAVYPRRGEPAVRQSELNDVIASAKVVIGDSCLVETRRGEPYARYCSDRVFEIPGRGGVLIHPWIEGVIGRNGDGLMTSGQHLMAYELGQFDQVRAIVNRLLKDPDERRYLAATGRVHVLANHTYERRLAEVLRKVGL